MGSASKLSRRMLVARGARSLAVLAVGSYPPASRRQAATDDPQSKATRHATRSASSATCRTTRHGKADYPYLLQDINDQPDLVLDLRRRPARPAATGRAATASTRPRSPNFNSLAAAADLGAGRQRLDRLLGPLRTGTQPYSDPIERLNHERALFNSTSQSLGEAHADARRASRARAARTRSIRRTSAGRYGPVVYLGLNVQGSNDNYPYHDTDAENPAAPSGATPRSSGMRDEETARKAADLHWLQEGFAYAKQIHAKGVLIVWQADPNFNNEQHLTNPHDCDAFAGLRRRAPHRDARVPGPGRARPRRQPLLQDGQAAGAAERQGDRATSRASRPSAQRAPTGCRRRSTRGAATSSRSSR